MHKKRGYKKETPLKLVRDYKLFAIACEGSKTEPQYFNLFRYMSSKIAVDVVEEIITDEEMYLKHSLKSSPKWVLDRAIKYVEKEGLSQEDSLWFVIDVDRWDIKQIKVLAEYCNEKVNWHIVLSNPCFEVWLYLHKKSNFNESKSNSSQQLKTELSNLLKGGYHHFKFIPFVKDAIENAKKIDTIPKHYYPEFKTTKVYLLCQELMKIIGNNQFDIFLNKNLPSLIASQNKSQKKR